jgi:hypothetical protein
VAESCYWVWHTSDDFADAIGGVRVRPFACTEVSNAVYLPKGEKVYRCKVGYFRNKNGQRKRIEFRLSNDPVIAHRKAISLEEKWLKEEIRHRRTVTDFQEVFNEPDESLPVWTGMPDAERLLREAYLTTPPHDLDDEASASEVAPGKTLAFWAEDVISRLRGKAERDQKAPRTFRRYEEQFKLGLVCPPINSSLDPRKLTLSHIETYCAF